MKNLIKKPSCLQRGIRYMGMSIGVSALGVGIFAALGVSASAVAAPDKTSTVATVSGIASTTANKATATFAGGCFWCVEADFDKVPGVLSTTSGYIGGKTANPSYEQVSSHSTGHAEAVQIVYNPAQVTYEKLLNIYWRSIDPTVKDQQFCDRGTPYRTAIFTHNDEQLTAAKASLVALEKSKPFREAIVTEIIPATAFYPAEDYHQNYHQKNSIRYKYYRSSCGRDARLKQLWGNQ